MYIVHDIRVNTKLDLVIAPFKESMTLNLAQRSFKAAIERSCTTLYRPLIVTFALSSTVSGILPYAQSQLFHTSLLFRLKCGMFP